MKSTSSICDPDSILTESQRYRLNHELSQLESRTRQEHARTFCEKKGITGAIALAKHVRGGSENAVRAMANDMLRRWSLDEQCQKSVVIVVATEDHRFWVARDPKVPVYGSEFSDIFNSQKPQFQSGQYAEALTNILQQTWQKALTKQGTPPGYGPDGSAGRGSSSGGAFKPGKSTGGGPGFSIPWWVWLVVIFIVVPIVCCCCCAYFMFFRKKDGAASSPRRQGPSDIEGGDGGGGRRGGGLGGGLQGLLGGLSGGAIMNALSGLRGRGNRQPAPAAPTDPYRPAQPQPTEGKGLYPSIPAKDEGGGGAW